MRRTALLGLLGLAAAHHVLFFHNLGPRSHLIQLFEDTDVGNNNPEPLHDSLELVEWGPVNNTVNASCYPSYQAWPQGVSVRCTMGDGGGDCSIICHSWEGGSGRQIHKRVLLF